MVDWRLPCGVDYRCFERVLLLLLLLLILLLLLLILLLTSILVMQNGANCMRAYVSKDLPSLLKWTDQEGEKEEEEEKKKEEEK